jgi:DNA repair exonuclease SbcCD nuclease subunit
MFLVGDTHIGLGYPNSVDRWHRVHQQYFSEFLLPLLRREVREGDVIVHLGDLFDNRNVIPINLMVFGMTVVEEMAALAPLHIILGNHDCWHKSSSEINSIRPFRWIPGVTLHESPAAVELAGRRLLMMPYVERRTDQLQIMDGHRGCDYLLCHSDLSGARMHLTSVAHKNPDKIGIEEFRHFAKVYSGHIHIRDTHRNFKFVGNVFQMDRNDYGDDKGVLAVDVASGAETFWRNGVSPRFERVSVTSEADLALLDGVDFGNYVDLSVSSSMLVGNRKLRRKLEVILESRQFASVTYLDDMSLGGGGEPGDAGASGPAPEDAGQQAAPLLEFKSYIREYIEGLQSSPAVRAGMLAEYDEVVRIYEENYESA